jgi:hypothetical protein
MQDRTVTDMRAGFQQNPDTGKHVDRATLLHIAAVFYDDFTEITAQRGKGPDIDIRTNRYASGHRSLRVHECGRMNDGRILLESVDHEIPMPAKLAQPDYIYGKNK